MKSGKSDSGKSGKSKTDKSGGRAVDWIDYDGDDDVPFSKANDSSGNYNSLLNGEHTVAVAQVSNQSEKRLQKQYAVWCLSIVFLPLMI